jgi:hypothetical protein
MACGDNDARGDEKAAAAGETPITKVSFNMTDGGMGMARGAENPGATIDWSYDGIVHVVGRAVEPKQWLFIL